MKNSETSELPPFFPPWLRARLERRPNVARALGNVGWLMVERVVFVLTSLVVNAVVVRYLGPSNVGLLSFAASLVALVAALATLGTDSIVVRELARRPEEEGAILGSALALRLAAGACTYLVIVALGLATAEDGRTAAVVALVAVNVFFTAAGVFDFWFQAHVRARELVIARTAVGLAIHAVRIGLVLLHGSLEAFAAMYAVTGASTALVTFLAFRRARTSAAPLTVSRPMLRTLVADSWPLLMSAVAVAVYLKIDQVMLASIVGDVENGVYATAAQLSESWFFLPLSIAATALPLIVRLRQSGDAAQVERQLQAFYDGMVAVAYAIAIPTALFAGPIVATLYGPAFARSADVLRVHILSFVFVCTGTARSRYLVAENYTRFSMISTALAAVLNVVLNLLWIPRHGALGAAWATVIAYAAAGYGMGFLDPTVRKQNLMLTRALAVPLRPRLLLRTLGIVR